MATQSHPPFPLSDLGPSELLWFERTDSRDIWKKRWVFWSRYNDELLYHPQGPRLMASRNDNPTMKEKIKCALQGLGPNFFYEAYLIQFWGLVTFGYSMYLTTCDQPFALSHRLFGEEDMKGLCRYRRYCLEYLMDMDQEGELGPPERVFRSGLPEYIIDASYYSSKEYPQHDLAVKYVKSYTAIPVYQSPGHNCIGVLEVVSPQCECFVPWDKLVNLLKKVGLTTNYPVWFSNYKQPSSCHIREMEQIFRALEVLCRTHCVPVARTWIEANSKEQLTVMHRGSYYGECRLHHMDIFGFYFIRKGHGVVGKAFSSQNACFCRDIRQLSITEYPLVPNARKYGLSSCFAICLQSSCLNSCIYTLEIILPTNKTNSGDPWTLLLTIMETLKQYLQSSFKVASGQELGQNLFIEVIKITSDDELDSFEISHATSGEFTPRIVEEQNEVGMTPLDGSFRQAKAAQQNVIVGSAPTPELVQNVESTRHRQPIEEFNTTFPAREDASMECNGNARDDASMEHDGNARDETTNLRKKASAYTLESELGITLEVLEQYSTLKVAGAAKALGVSRSTLKRICRRYDIHRWPPCKGKKYNQVSDQQEIAQPSKKNIGEHSMSVATRLPDNSSIMVKTTYGDVIIKFQLSLSARKMDLVEKVAMRLNLEVGSFRIMYLDEEDDWVSITCDEDLSVSLSMLRSVRKTTIKMLVSQ